MTDTQKPENPPKDSASPFYRAETHESPFKADEKNATPPGDEQVPAWVMPVRSVVRFFRRFRYRAFFLRLVVHGFLLFVLLLVGGYFAIKTWVKPSDVSAFLKAQVEKQTGGRLDIANLTFNVLTGIRLEGVQFYPPAAGDTRGYVNGGDVNPIPIANFDALDVQYSIPKLLAGRIHIKALQLVEPQVHLKRTDGGWNFDSILTYRKANFPDVPEARPAEQDKPNEPSAPPPDITSYASKLLYMPVEILAQNIGIKNLRLDMITEEQGQVAQILLTSGVSFDVGAHWFGAKSSFWFQSLSPFERPLELDVRDAKRDGEGKITGDLVQTLLVKSALNTRFELANFKQINFDFATRVMKLATPVAGFEDLGTYLKVRLTAGDDYKSVKIDSISAEVADALRYGLKGLVSTPSFDFEQITLKLTQSLHVDLKQAAVLAKPFVPTLTAGGAINSDDLEVEGTIEPKALQNASASFPVPYVWGVVWIEEIFVNYPEIGIAMEPISGDLQLSAGPAMNGQGSQIDLDVDMLVPKLVATQKIGGGKVTAGVEDLSFKLTTRALWPEMIAPIFKLNVEAEHVRSFGDKIPTIDAPLYVDVDAEGRQDLLRLGLTANVELTGLAEMSAMADCQARCTRFRSNVTARLDSLAKLHQIALPFAGLFGAGDFMPTKLTGALDFQFAARGRLPDPLATPVPQLLKASDVQFNTQVNLTKLSAKVPAFKVDLQGFEARIGAGGSLQQQKVDLAHKFESLSLELPSPPNAPADAKPQVVEVSRFSFDTGITNDIDGPLDLARPLNQLITAVTTRLHVGKVGMDGVLPRPVTDIQLQVDASQSKLTDIELKELVVKLPDFGTSVSVQAQTKIGPDFLPQSLKTKLVTSISHTGDEKLPLGIKTSGNVDVRLDLQSSDMKLLAVNGETSFENFYVTVPALDAKPGEQKPPLLVVEEIKGQIPFKQLVPLPDLKAVKAGETIAEATKKAAEAAKRAQAPAAAKEAEDDEATDGEAAELQAGQEQKNLDNAMAQYFEKNDDKIMKSANVAAMVDYGTVRPFFPERRPLSIKRLEAANLELSKMEFDLELRQNWFAVNQYVINVIGGKLQGDLQLAFDPLPRNLRTSLHMTRLDTRKLLERFPNLKGKQSGWSPFGNPYIDGTIHLKYDMKNNDMSGGVEITSIGKDQLKAMLYFVDPFEQNPTISDIRTALNLGEVRQVSIPMKNGEIDLGVDVRVLGAPLPTPKLSRFPISQILQNFKDQAMKDAAQPAAPAAAPAEAAKQAAAVPAKDAKGI